MPYVDLDGQMWTIDGPSSEQSAPAMPEPSIRPASSPSPAAPSSDAMGAGIRTSWERVVARENVRRGFTAGPAIETKGRTEVREKWAAIIEKVNGRLRAAAAAHSEPSTGPSKPITDRQRWRSIIDRINGAPAR